MFLSVHNRYAPVPFLQNIKMYFFTFKKAVVYVIVHGLDQVCFLTTGYFASCHCQESVMHVCMIYCKHGHEKYKMFDRIQS